MTVRGELGSTDDLDLSIGDPDDGEGDDLSIGDGEGNPDDGDGGDDTPDAVLEKFGGDPAKLAKAYRALERKLGQQGSELGLTRAEVEQFRQMVEQLGEGGVGGKPKPNPKEAFLAKVKAAQESGEGVDLQALFGELWDSMKADVDESVGEVKGVLRQQETSAIWDRFTEANPKAKALEPRMTELYRDNPGLLILNKGRGAFVKSLKQLYTLAAASSNGKSTRSRGSLDAGGRGHRLTSALERGGAGNLSKDERYLKLREQAQRSGRASDWQKVVMYAFNGPDED